MIEKSRREQSIAKAVDIARRASQSQKTPMRIKRNAGGSVTKTHSGPIHSPVAGRTDHLPMNVKSGSYVIPADIISAMGEGNTMAGFKHMRRMFEGVPFTGKDAPYTDAKNPYDGDDAPYNGEETPYGEDLPSGAAKASGGAAFVPIVAAGGEYVLAPHEVLAAGEGDLETGHRVLDEWVKRMRSETIKTLKKLPGPRKD